MSYSSEYGYSICDYCHDPNNDVCEFVNGYDLCEDCADAHFPECAECGERFDRSKMSSIDGEWLCESCADNQQQDNDIDEDIDAVFYCDNCGQDIKHEPHDCKGMFLCDDCYEIMSYSPDEY